MAEPDLHSNPNNPVPGEPSTPLQVALWESAQAQSQAYSEQTDFMYQQSLPTDGTFAPGQGSQGPGTFFTNGQPPNAGNQP